MVLTNIWENFELIPKLSANFPRHAKFFEIHLQFSQIRLKLGDVSSKCLHWFIVKSICAFVCFYFPKGRAPNFPAKTSQSHAEVSHLRPILIIQGQKLKQFSFYFTLFLSCSRSFGWYCILSILTTRMIRQGKPLRGKPSQLLLLFFKNRLKRTSGTHLKNSK